MEGSRFAFYDEQGALDEAEVAREKALVLAPRSGF